MHRDPARERELPAQHDRPVERGDGRSRHVHAHRGSRVPVRDVAGREVDRRVRAHEVRGRVGRVDDAGHPAGRFESAVETADDIARELAPADPVATQRGGRRDPGQGLVAEARESRVHERLAGLAGARRPQELAGRGVLLTGRAPALHDRAIGRIECQEPGDRRLVGHPGIDREDAANEDAARKEPDRLHEPGPDVGIHLRQPEPGPAPRARREVVRGEGLPLPRGVGTHGVLVADDDPVRRRVVRHRPDGRVAVRLARAPAEPRQLRDGRQQRIRAAVPGHDAHRAGRAVDHRQSRRAMAHRARDRRSRRRRAGWASRSTSRRSGRSRCRWCSRRRPPSPCPAPSRRRHGAIGGPGHRPP